jgi:hypothetical protein
MLILHIFPRENYTAYIGSSGDKFIFNIVPSDQAKPSGGYVGLEWIFGVKNLPKPYLSMLIKKAELIMNKPYSEN